MGVLVVASMAIKASFTRIHLPALIGYMALGLVLRFAEAQGATLSETAHAVLEFLGKLGVIALLFRVGLESDLGKLLSQLRGASFILLGNVAASAGLGYLTARYAAGLEFLPSFVVATAFTATSVGIPVRIWQNRGKLETETGQEFLDVAELDDITGVVLMGLLFAVLPILRGNGEGDIGLVLAWTTTLFLAKLALFAGLCYLFSRYAEQRLTRFAEGLVSKPDPMLVVAGTGILIAGLAGLLGFSAAIGGFFAGLVFSRDPKRVQYDASFCALYDLFAPFFFITIGFSMAPGQLLGAATLGGVLFLAATASKIAGTFAPAMLLMPSRAAAVLSVSMVPRAEITMLIMHRAHRAGEDVAPGQAYSAMVIVSALTCLFAPLVLDKMLARSDFIPQQDEA